MSNTVIQIKRSHTNATPTVLANGELAYSFQSNNLFIGANSDTNEVIKIGGGSGVVKDIEDNQVVMGYPAVPFKEFIKNWKK